MTNTVQERGAPAWWNSLERRSAFIAGYVEAMFFTWPDDDGDSPANVGDLAPETLARIFRDCRHFQQRSKATLTAVRALYGYDSQQAGRDFWFTRNGYGVGYWDRGLGDLGDRLTRIAGRFGTVDPYRGDDGRVYMA
jgi:hypothetical protein